MNAYAPLPSQQITRACDIRLGDWCPADRFYCTLTGHEGILKFDPQGRCWFVTGKVLTHMTPAKLDSLVLVKECANWR